MSKIPDDEAVKACYSTWSETYHADYYGGKAAYPPVHVGIVRRLLAESGARTVLDAGCGPASMLRELFDLGLDLYGFDLTPEMVAEGRRIFAAQGLPPQRVWEGSVLDPEAFRGGGADVQAGFDAVVCSGVMPHVPPQADDAVPANLGRAVRPGGLVILEARNQLFSLFTMNRYSHEFFLHELLDAKGLRDAAGREREALEGVLDELGGMFRTDLPPLRRGKEGEPGYDEVVSRTHNPLVLKARFAALGFRDVRLLFYHYHCLPPMFEARLPAFFRERSLAMEDPEDWRGHFLASAFFVVGTRP